MDAALCLAFVLQTAAERTLFMANGSSTQPQTSWLRNSAYPLPILITLLAFGLSLYALDGKSLWFDEMGTLACARADGSWLDVIRCSLTLPLTPKPPAHFLVTHLFLGVAQNAFVLRLTAAIFATLTVTVTHVLGTRLSDRKVGLIGATLLAFAPLHLRYAQEARMYSMFAFFSVLSLYVFWRAIHSDEKGWWAAFALTTALNLYTHLFAVLPLGVLVVFSLWVLIRRRDGSRFPFPARYLFVTLAVIGLIFVPLIPPVYRGLSSGEGLGGAAAQDWGLDAFQGALRLFSGGNAAGAIVYGLLYILAAAVLASRDRDVLLLSLLWIGLPIAAVLITPFGHEARARYFLFALPVFLLLAAQGLTTVASWLTKVLARLWPTASSRRGLGALITIALTAILVGISVPSVSALYAETKQNWRDATWLVRSQAKPGDQVYVAREYHQAGVRFYLAQWAETAGPLGRGNVHILPADLSTLHFPLDGEATYWFIVPDKPRFQPSGELDTILQPYFHLTDPTILGPTRIPEDKDLIAPVSFGSVQVVRAELSNPPTVRFWSEKDSIQEGACTILNWELERVREIYLDGEGVVGQGQREVCPTSTTTYELRVVLLDDSVRTETLVVTVDKP